jgi:hypothetical protein
VYEVPEDARRTDPPTEGPRSRSARQLPARRPDRTWRGLGVGEICTLCEKPVTKDDMEFQIGFSRGYDVTGGVDKSHVHIRYFAARDFERKHAGEPPRWQTVALRLGEASPTIPCARAEQASRLGRL